MYLPSGETATMPMALPGALVPGFVSWPDSWELDRCVADVLADAGGLAGEDGSAPAGLAPQPMTSPPPGWPKIGTGVPIGEFFVDPHNDWGTPLLSTNVKLAVPDG